MKTTKGTTGHDGLTGTKAADLIHGLEGNDTIKGLGGSDRIWGDDGIDWLYGDGGSDTLFGNAGDDFLFGGAGKDLLDGGDGNDILVGDAGNDTIKGGEGNDRLFANTGNDTLNGGNGNDYYSVMADAPKITDKSGAERYEIAFNDLRPSSAWISDVGGLDEIVFKGFELGQLEFMQSGLDLVIRVEGFKQETTLSYFFAEAKYQVEQLEVSNGKGGLKEYDLTEIEDGEFMDFTSGDTIWL
ncbi:calcium-binding protein [Rhizobium setariae]|nr:calcium-binding protein [Rhizobium setariae]